MKADSALNLLAAMIFRQLQV